MNRWRTRAAGASIAVIGVLAIACSFGRPYTYDTVTKPAASLAGYGQWQVEAPTIPGAVANQESGEDWKTLIQQLSSSLHRETEKSLNALRSSGKPLQVRLEIGELKRPSWPVRPRMVINVSLVDPSSGSCVGAYTVGGYVKTLDANDMPYYAGCIAEFLDDY